MKTPMKQFFTRNAKKIEINENRPFSRQHWIPSRRVASRRRRWHGEEGEEEEEEEVEVHLERLDGGRGLPPKAKCFVPRGRHHVSRVIFFTGDSYHEMLHWKIEF